MLFRSHQLISHEAKHVSLSLVDQNCEPLVNLTRPATGSFELSVATWSLTENQKMGTDAIFTRTSYAPDLANASAHPRWASWCGQDDPDKVESIICKILAMLETSLESGNVYVQLHVPFV